MLRRIIRSIPGARRVAHAVGLGGNDKRSRGFVLEYFPKLSSGAEVGVHLGDFSDEILRVVQPKVLHLIDPWAHQTEFSDAWYGGKAIDGQGEMDRRLATVLERFERERSSGQIEIHREFSVPALEKFPDASLDWVYIDANHLYEYVTADLEVSFKKVKRGGYIAGDDYKEGGWWKGGVKRAVDEFARREDVHLVEVRNSQFVFQKI